MTKRLTIEDIGHWQKEMPTQPGAYWVASRDGMIMFEHKVVCIDAFGHPAQRGVQPYNRWSGWWWSHTTVYQPSRPNVPVPKWED